ncbi:MAG: DUF2147 domain-containing protein [Bacteroidetes bacterium]|jgi:uncharacterized protein (DUF2147 family)|nr:DUF2147 domain-containing protein [Bacteroidota bacterium]
MKKLTLLFTISFITISMYSQADAITGQWYTDGKESVIEIYSKNGKFYGKVVWMEEPHNEDGTIKRDKENPNAKLRNRPLKGLEIMKGLEYDAADHEWLDGEIYDPENGKTYSCQAELKGNDKLALRGYVGVSLIGRTTEWTRKK